VNIHVVTFWVVTPCCVERYHGPRSKSATTKKKDDFSRFKCDEFKSELEKSLSPTVFKGKEMKKNYVGV
jgi:hypothetical protein